MSHILEMLAFAVVMVTALFVLVTLSQARLNQRVMVMRLRRDMRQIDVHVVDWKRDLDNRR